MARPVWTGTISFGLVAIPVKMFHAVRRRSVSFNQLDERNMARIRYRKVNAETGEEVSDDHIVKGFEFSKGQYVVVDPDELEPFMPVATKSIDLEEFVDLGEIDPIYFDTAYHLAPNGSAKPYALLARAMEASGKVAIGRFVMRNKQYAAAIRAEEGRLVMSSLAYADEVVDPADIDELQGIDDVEVTRKEMVMAESLVESLSADFEPDKYHDEYRDQVLALIDKKVAGEEFEAPAATAEKPNVIDIMAALEASVSAAKEARGRHPARQSDQRSTSLSGKTAAKKLSAKRVTAAKPTKRAAGNGAAKKAADKTSSRKTSPGKTSPGKKAAGKKAAGKTAPGKRAPVKKAPAKKSA